MLDFNDTFLCETSTSELLVYIKEGYRNETWMQGINDTFLLYKLRSMCNTTPEEVLSERSGGYSYSSAVPIVIIVFCVLTFIFNIFIVVSAHWMRRPLTPTMYFSLSLAAADAISSLTLGLGLILNSLLSTAYKIHIVEWSPCTMLSLEAIRLGAIIVTVFHLLALAVNHYIGIARPLHYAAIMTKRTATLCIVIMWIGPIAALFAYFSSIEHQGFQAENCPIEFMQKLRFRGQYASFFFAPLFIMIFIYAHIFVIIRRHQVSRQTLTQHTASSRQNTLSSNSSSVKSSARFHPCSERCRRSSSGSANCGNQQGSISRRAYPSIQHAGATRNLARSTNTDNGNTNSTNGVRKNIKAIITTLLIVGTFIICWMPAVIWYIIYCQDCVLPFKDPPSRYIIGISITVNCLIVLKAFLDPIIYTARMKDFKVAFRRMRHQILPKCFPRCQWSNDTEGATIIHFQHSGNLDSHSHQRNSVRLVQMSMNRSEAKFSRAIDKSELAFRLSDLPEGGENGLSEHEFASLNRAELTTAVPMTEPEGRHC